MGNQVLTNALPPASERQIRRLRFADWELEQAFRLDYAEKSRIHLRIVMSLVVIIPTLSLARDILRSQPLGMGSLAVDVVGFLINWGALLLTWSPQFPHYFQPYMAFVCLFMGVSLTARMLPTTQGIGPVLVASLITYTLYRLRFVTAVLVYWTIVAFFLVDAAWVLHIPPDTLSRWLTGVAIANFMGMLACYTLERAARRDFLLSRLLQQEREKSERLLLNVLPSPVAERLKETPGTLADSFAEVTVLFADIVDFTPLSARLSPKGTVELLNEVFSCFDQLAEQHSLEKIKTIGDAYMVVGGLPEPGPDHAEAVIAMALDMQQEIGRFQRDAGDALRLRIGINTGPVVAGVIGTKKFIYDLWGDTVNMAARLESHGLPGRIQVSEATRDCLRHPYRFAERRLVNVKGKGEMTAYVLLDESAKAIAGGGTPPSL